MKSHTTYSPFLELIKKGDLSEVKSYVKTGFFTLAEDKTENSALRSAAKHGHLDIVQWLLDEGMPVDGRPILKSPQPHFGFIKITKLTPYIYLTPLMTAVIQNNLEIVKLLIERGADVNLRAAEGTALSYAIIRGHLDIVKILASHPNASGSQNMFGKIYSKIQDIENRIWISDGEQSTKNALEIFSVLSETFKTPLVDESFLKKILQAIACWLHAHGETLSPILSQGFAEELTRFRVYQLNSFSSLIEILRILERYFAERKEVYQFSFNKFFYEVDLHSLIPIEFKPTPTMQEKSPIIEISHATIRAYLESLKQIVNKYVEPVIQVLPSDEASIVGGYLGLSFSIFQRRDKIIKEDPIKEMPRLAT